MLIAALQHWRVAVWVALLALAAGQTVRLDAATAKQPTKNHADTVGCERDRDRLEALGQLAGEGVELLAEGRNLLQQRDHEVALLLDQIRLDRASCEAPR